MHDVKVVFKDDRENEYGPLWMWRPREGWFSITTQDGLLKVRLSEVAESVNSGIRVTKDKIKDVDLLDRARREGWDGT